VPSWVFDDVERRTKLRERQRADNARRNPLRCPVVFARDAVVLRSVVHLTETITFRPDEDTSRALAVLTRDGTPVSAAVRAALIQAARHKVTAAIRAEAEELAADDTDRAEAMQVLRDMETLRAR
jgi:hypothetical protein